MRIRFFRHFAQLISIDMLGMKICILKGMIVCNLSSNIYMGTCIFPPLVFLILVFLVVSGIYLIPYRISTIIECALKKYMNQYIFCAWHAVTLPNGARGHFLSNSIWDFNNESIQIQREALHLICFLIKNYIRNQSKYDASPLSPFVLFSY